MKIHGLEVDGFGAWHGLTMSEFADGLTVVYGPNEAGKTTLMQFVRAMLYGFSDDRRARYLPPLGGGRGGGRLHVSNGRGRVVVGRHDDPRNTIDGLVRIVDARGGEQEAPSLNSLLSGVDEPIFRNVFAIGMREIQELGALSDTAAADMLYKLATGLDRVSLVEVLRELDASRNRLLSTDGKPSQITQLRGERQRLSDEASRLAQQSREYGRLSQERQRIDDALAALEVEQRQCQDRLDWLEKAVAGRDPWQRRGDIAAELKALGDVRTLRAGAIEEFEALEARYQLWKRRLAGVNHKRTQLRRDARKLRIRDWIVRHGSRIEALCEQRGWLKSLAAQTTQLQNEIEQAGLQLADMHRELGLPQPVEGKPSFDPAAMERLKPLARQCRAAHHRLVQTKRAAKRSESDLSKQQADAEKKLAKHGDEGVLAAHQKAGELVTKLRRRVQLDEKLAAMTRDHSEIADEKHEVVDRQFLPVWLLSILGGVFVLGVVLMLAGSLLTHKPLGATGWVLAVLGLLSAGAAAGVKHWMEHAAARDFDINEQQTAQLAKQIADAKAERDKLDAELPKGGGPLLSRLQAAEKEQAAIENLLPLEADRKSLKGQHHVVRKKWKETKDDFEAARKRWRQGLESAGLPSSLSPKQLRNFDEHRDALEDLSRGIMRRRHELADRLRERDALHQRVVQVAVDAHMKLDAHMKPEDEKPDELLDALHDVWVEQQQRVERRKELRKNDRRLRALGQKASRAAAISRRRRQALLDEAGAADGAQLRRSADQAARVQWLENEHESLGRELARAWGEPSVNEFERFLTAHSRDDAGRQQSEVSQRRDEVSRQVRSLAEQRGQLNERLRGMSGDTQLGDRLLDRNMIDAQLAEATERWQVLAVTHRVLATVRKRYEAHRQPEALREASQYLNQMTSGRYTRVWTPLDEDVLRVDDHSGQSIRVEVLSRGTREQLFLSLRLALASAYARRGAHLPMVLDDVLVNFDACRAGAAAEVLRDFAARGHQLIVFTCHEHMANLFRTRGATVLTLPEKGGHVRIEPPVRAEPVVRAEHAPIAVSRAEPKLDLPPIPSIDFEPEIAPEPPRRPRKKLRIEKHAPVVRMHRPPSIFATSVWHESKDEPT